MRKLLRKRDILLLTLAEVGDTFEEAKDPLHLVSNAYGNMYGFIPEKYRRHNFSSLVGNSLKTGYIEKIVRDGKAYLRIASSGRSYLEREFSIIGLTKKWNKKWVIVIFDIEEKFRSKRNRLTKILRNLGFGILQDSVWISPLPIGQDVKESLSHQGFSDNAFVLEISDVLLGDPKELANRVWGLDKLEEEYLSLKNNNDRHNKNDNNDEELRSRKGKLLEFLVTLPPLPKELFPDILQKAKVKK